MHSLFDLKGQVALVTGAAHGLGLAIAQALAAQGAAVVLADIDAAGCEGAAAALRAEAADTIAMGCDVGNADGLLGNSSFMDRRLSLTPLRRVGEPHEIAGVVAMLASRAGGFIAGQTLVVDGGTVISDGN